jgi:fermentation-respiration switch protein FrsA (DUF1100 family)
MTKDLYAACKSTKKELWVVQGGNHNDTWLVGGADYVNKLKQFFAKNRSQSETKKDQ